MGRQWSDQQQDIFTWFEGGCPRIFAPDAPQHLIVRARSGTGKTTTIIEGVNRAPESSILLCAFNKKIAEELNTRLVNVNSEAKTLHALGYAAIRRQWRGMPVSQGTNRADSLTDMVCTPTTPKPIRRLIAQLHTKARDMGIPQDAQSMTDAALFFDLAPDESWTDYSLWFVVERALAAVAKAATEDPTYDIGIDFADMIYLPLAWNLLSKEYDMVVVDEAQDLTMAQLTMAQRVCSGRICVVGDDKQCQPAGTVVETAIRLPRHTGNFPRILRQGVPIETIKVGDYVTSFALARGWTSSCRVAAIGSRFYSGELVVVRPYTSPQTSRYTPKHRCVTRYQGTEYCVYLMQRGSAFRLGMSCLRSSTQSCGPLLRMRFEDAEAVWILDTFASRREAAVAEARLSAKFRIPQLMFTTKTESGAGLFTREELDDVWRGISNYSDALQVLQTFGRLFEWPYFKRDDYKFPTSKHVGRFGGVSKSMRRCRPFRRPHIVQACNILKGAEVKLRNGRWSKFQLSREHYEGFVYSLAVDRDELYFADGVLTHNSIYGFRGADSGSLDRLKHELEAGELSLTTTYRCCQAVVRRAQTLVPDIVAGDGNPEGQIDACSHEELLDKAEPPQFILSRLNAPLVSITLQLLRRKKRARMAGRDIGAGIQTIVRKLGVYEKSPIEDMLTKLNSWESKTCTRLASYGQVALIDRCRDQAAMIRALAEDAEDMGDLTNRVDWLFTDENTAKQILCSSVHKAKGLEANRVYILQESLYRRGVTPEEQNIEYVAITRAKSHLTLVTGVPGLAGRR